MYKYVCDRTGDTVLSYLLDENGHALEVHADSMVHKPSIGDIYVGTVQDIVSSIGAAFIDAGAAGKLYLPLTEAETAHYVHKGSSEKMQQGDQLIVKIAREAIKTKSAAATTTISVTGVYCVLELGGRGCGVSSKIAGEKRRELKELAQSLADGMQENVSIVIRTNASSATDEDIGKEVRLLYADLEQILNKGEHSVSGTCIYHEPFTFLKRLKGLQIESTEKICVEDPEIYELVSRYLEQCFPILKEKIVFFQDRLVSMHSIFSLTRELEHATDMCVYMKSGAWLVIEHTEALNVIDVNSGKMDARAKKAGKEEKILKINMEAAAECARQIRLRNLSGIILIDFINMEEEKSRQQLMDHLKKHLSRDPVYTALVDMTALGLVEITRKKTEPPFHEIWREMKKSDKFEK